MLRTYEKTFFYFGEAARNKTELVIARHAKKIVEGNHT